LTNHDTMIGPARPLLPRRFATPPSSPHDNPALFTTLSLLFCDALPLNQALPLPPSHHFEPSGPPIIISNNNVPPLVVLLEPLVLGVLPASVLPTVVALLVLLGVVACSVLRNVLGKNRRMGWSDWLLVRRHHPPCRRDGVL
jgi:hypothetical protein